MAPETGVASLSNSNSAHMSPAMGHPSAVPSMGSAPPPPSRKLQSGHFKPAPHVPTPSVPGAEGKRHGRKRASSRSSGSATVNTATGMLSSRITKAVVVVMSSLNDTFDKKSLVLPYYPEVMKLGRQTNSKTLQSPDNGFFDSRVLSRQHAEIWADPKTKAVYIQDTKSSNGTYVNGVRLSSDDEQSKPHELRNGDVLELGIDIKNEDDKTQAHRKIAAKIDRITIMNLNSSSESLAGPGSGAGSGLEAGNGLTRTNSTSSISSIGSISSTGSTSSISTVSGGVGRKDANGGSIDTLDASLFGDISSGFEDLSLGMPHNSVGGLFMNSGIGTSLSLEYTVRILFNEIHMAKTENAKLKSVEKLLKDYKRELELKKKEEKAAETRMAVEITNLQEEIAALKKSEKLLIVKAQEGERLKQLVESSREENEQLKRLLSEKETGFLEMSRKVETTEQELEDIRGRYCALEIELESSRQTITDLESKNRQEVEKSSEISSKVGKLSEELKISADKIAETEQKIAETEQNLAKTETLLLEERKKNEIGVDQVKLKNTASTQTEHSVEVSSGSESGKSEDEKTVVSDDESENTEKVPGPHSKHPVAGGKKLHIETSRTVKRQKSSSKQKSFIAVSFGVLMVGVGLALLKSVQTNSK